MVVVLGRVVPLGEEVAVASFPVQEAMDHLAGGEVLGSIADPPLALLNL